MDHTCFPFTRRWFPYRRVVLAVVAALVSVLSYPIGGGRWVSGVPLPVVIFERSADETSSLPFLSPISLVALFVNFSITIFVLLWLMKLFFAERNDAHPSV